MTRRSVFQSALTLLSWTGVSIAVGALMGWALYRSWGSEALGAAAIALLVDAVLLTLSREGASGMAALATTLDSASDALRDRWIRFIEERHRELELAIVLQYGIVVIGALFLGATVPRFVAVPDIVKAPAIPENWRTIVSVALATAGLPSLWRIVAAPRRIMKLRYDLMSEVREDKRLQADSAAAIERARSGAIRVLQVK